MIVYTIYCNNQHCTDTVVNQITLHADAVCLGGQHLWQYKDSCLNINIIFL